MNKPKYKKGDRVGVWTIFNVHYDADFGYVYELYAFKKAKKQQLRCSEEIVDSIVNNAKSA